MNIISSLFQFIGNKIKSAQTVKTKTAEVGDGTCWYVHTGNLVTVNFIIKPTSTIPASSYLFRGLPPIAGEYTLGTFWGFGATVGFRIAWTSNTEAAITNDEAIAQQSGYVRCAFSYVSSQVG